VLHTYSTVELHGSSSHLDFPPPYWLNLHRCTPEPVFDLLRWGATDCKESLHAERGSTLPPSTQDYVSSIRRVCKAHDIDFIFPVSDFDVWAFSNDGCKSNPRVLAASPCAFAALADKYTLATEASLSGLLVPSTVLLKTGTQLTDYGGPDTVWRSKARFGSGSSFQRVFCAGEFETVRRINALIPIPAILQLELPIKRHVSLNCVATNGAIVLIFQLEKASHLNPSWSTAIRVVDELPDSVICGARAMVKRHNISGFLAMQFISDNLRDWYLIDMNLRLGNNWKIFGPYFPEILWLIFKSFEVVIPKRQALAMRDMVTLSRDLRRFAAVALADEVVGALRTRRLPYVKPRYLAHIRDLFIRLLVSNPRTASWHLGSMAKAAGTAP
jgi:hypothetical protein